MFTIQMNANALSARFRQRAAALTPAVLAAETQSAQAAYRTAQRLSCGSVPASYLRRAARQRKAGLYSRQAPAPPGPPWIINAQTSRLKRSWRYHLKWSSSGSQVTLWNTSPYAKYLKTGTSRMIARPIMERIAEEERLPRIMRLRKAMLASMQKK